MRTKRPLIQSIFYSNPDYYPPIINGACLFDQAGFDHELLCRKHRDDMRVTYPESARVVRFGSPTRSAWREYFEFVWRALRHGSARSSFFIGYDMHGLLPARLLAARYRRPLIYHCHDYVENGHKLTRGSAIVKVFERLFARTADLVIVPDRDRAQVMVDQLRLRVFPLVVANAALHRPDPASNRLAQALAERGKNWRQVALRQGSIGAGHCIEATLRSIPYWSQPDWGFAVLGMGEARYIAELEHLAAALGVADRFAILPPVPYRDVAQFTVGAQLGHALYAPININNQFITTASNKTLEYMAAGIPQLLSDTPGSRALLDRYACGVTARFDSPESIAAAVNAVLGDSGRARRLGEAAAKAFEEEFNYRRQFAPVIERLQKYASHTG